MPNESEQLALFDAVEPEDKRHYTFEPSADGQRFDIWCDGVLQVRVERHDGGTGSRLIDAPPELQRPPKGPRRLR